MNNNFYQESLKLIQIEVYTICRSNREMPCFKNNLIKLRVECFCRTFYFSVRYRTFFKKVIMDDRPDQKESSFFDYPPLLEPLFWGTGDLLRWDVTQLLETIDRDSLFRIAWVQQSLTDEEYFNARKEVFEPVFKELTDLITTHELLDPCGFYGYFPVISDAGMLILLDPSDFHSELISLTSPATEIINGHPVTDLFRPEGDVIAISAVTSGKRLITYSNELVAGYDPDKKGYFLQGIAASITDTLTTKIAHEIRRGLGIMDTTGKLFSLRIDDPCFLQMCEIMSVEERLGIGFENRAPSGSKCSAMNYFVHHPATNHL
jgi:hypothetical protein